MDDFHKPEFSTIEPFPIVIQNSSSNWAGTFPGGPVVKNPPYDAGAMGSIHGRGTKILHSVEQLSPSITTTEPAHHNLSSWASAKDPTYRNWDQMQIIHKKVK